MSEAAVKSTSRPPVRLRDHSLRTDPASLKQIPRECIPEALGALERARAVLWARLTVPRPAEGKEKPREGIDERLLTAQEVAERLQTSRHWVYRHAGKLGGVKVGGRMRFTREGLGLYLARNRKRP